MNPKILFIASLVSLVSRGRIQMEQFRISDSRAKSKETYICCTLFSEYTVATLALKQYTLPLSLWFSKVVTRLTNQQLPNQIATSIK